MTTESTPRKVSWQAIAAAVLLLALVAGAAFLWRWQAHQLSGLQAGRAEDDAAVQAATRETSTWAHVDYRTSAQYFSAVEKGATGLFLDQFKASESATKQLLSSNRSVQVPVIPKDGAALMERSGTTAKVLIAMDATVTNKSTTKPQPRQYRLQVTLTKQGGQWLISNLGFIDAQS
jgi:Mce-associated membrane protein